MRAGFMKMACMQKWAIGMLVLGIGMDRAAGARLLRQSESVASATVSGSPGSTGQAQVAFSSPQGSFSQTIPISGSGGVQFSSANGGTLTIPGADGVPQTFTSVLGPVGAPLPPPLVPSVPLPTVESITRNLPSVALPGSDDDLAAQVRARIKAFFAEYYRSFKPPQQTGVVVARQAGTVAVQSPTVAPRAVAAAPRAVAAAPQTPVVVQQTSGSDPRVQRVSASVTAPGSTSLSLSSVNTGR